MRIMKKLSWLFVLASSLLIVSCGEKEEVATSGEGIKAEITVQAEEAWVPYYEAAIARVKEKNPDAKIEIKTVGSFDHIGVIDNTDSSNADVADVFAYPADRMISLNQKEALASMDSKALADRIGGFTNFDNGLGGMLQVDGDYIGFPMNIETLLNFINTTNAKEAGIDYSKSVEMTTAPFNSVNIPVIDAWFAVAVVNSSNIELLGKNSDGTFFSDMTKEFSELTPEQQATITGLFEYWQAASKEKAPLFDASSVWGYLDEQFKTGGKTAVRIEGPWSAVNLTNLAGEENIAVAPIGRVTFKGQPLRHWQGGWALGINSRLEEDADKYALAVEVIAEIMNPMYAADFYKAAGKIMPNVTVEEYAKTDLSDTDKNIISAVVEGYGDAVARPLFLEWGQVWDTWKNSILSWDSKKPTSPEEAYKEIKASFDAMMENLK